jgi:hypothetical protein
MYVITGPVFGLQNTNEEIVIRELHKLIMYHMI